MIDELEGDSFLVAVEDLAYLWRLCVVPVYIDNRAFQRSASKGWSRAERLGRLLRRLFSLSISHECMFEFHWVASLDNIYADALSRPEGEALFLSLVEQHAPLPLGISLMRHTSSGHTPSIPPPHFGNETHLGERSTKTASREFCIRSWLGTSALVGLQKGQLFYCQECPKHSLFCMPFYQISKT